MQELYLTILRISAPLLDVSSGGEAEEAKALFPITAMQPLDRLFFRSLSTDHVVSPSLELASLHLPASYLC
jgi:hypothetical protein